MFDGDPDAGIGPFCAWVVYNNLSKAGPETTLCPQERTILIVGEPPSRSVLHAEYADQFSTIVTCLPISRERGVLRRQQSLPWWAGLSRTAAREFTVSQNYDAFAAMSMIEKSREISLICSSLAITPHHRKRLRFIGKLARHFGDRLDIFGEGFNRVTDKWNAIAPYRYHIVLENSCIDDYWTEKLADAFLGAAMPIYSGCPNATEYFSQNAFVPIDISRPREAIEIIEALLVENPYESVLPAIWAARSAVLEKYNVFAEVAALVDGLPEGPTVPVTIRPVASFRQSQAARLASGINMFREGVARSWMKLSG